MAVYLNFKYGDVFQYGGKFKVVEITKWRYFKYGSSARRLNFKMAEYLNMANVHHFMERGGRVVS
jgi:hypothetical protein